MLSRKWEYLCWWCQAQWAVGWFLANRWNVYGFCCCYYFFFILVSVLLCRCVRVSYEQESHLHSFIERIENKNRSWQTNVWPTMSFVTITISLFPCLCCCCCSCYVRLYLFTHFTLFHLVMVVILLFSFSPYFPKHRYDNESSFYGFLCQISFLWQ